MTCYLYSVVRRENGDQYVGVAKDPKRRWSDHKRLSRVKPQGYFHSALAKYGPESFDWQVLAEFSSDREAKLAEMCLIYSQNPTYNLTIGGDGTSGLKLTAEHVEKVASANRGKKRTPESCARISAGLTGKKKGPMSERHKKKIGLAIKGRVQTPEHNAAISAGKTGKKTGPQKPEHVAKRADAVRGIKRSEETKAKMSVAQQARRQREAA